jgi:sec-independent protein translocase protein TatB
MFDIGFSELLVIGVVALVVIGPERLPKVARTAGHLYGRMQRYVSAVKSDISREMEFDELRRAGQQFKESVEATVSDVKQQGTVVDDFLRNETASIGKEITAMPATAGDRTVTEPVPAQPQGDQKHQQSLPLDEPDQNKVAPHSAVVETARSESAGKTT